MPSYPSLREFTIGPFLGRYDTAVPVGHPLRIRSYTASAVRVTMSADYTGVSNLRCASRYDFQQSRCQRIRYLPLLAYLLILAVELPKHDQPATALESVEAVSLFHFPDDVIWQN